MEKLELQKFEDYKLDKKQLSYVYAGDICTGGGVGRIDDDHGYTIYSYDSDSIANGHITFTNYQSTHYYNGVSDFFAHWWDELKSEWQ